MNETSNEVTYNRIDVTDEWHPPGGNTSNPVKSAVVKPTKNRKERLTEQAIKRRIKRAAK